jgi:hypothetical protein
LDFIEDDYQKTRDNQRNDGIFINEEMSFREEHNDNSGLRERIMRGSEVKDRDDNSFWK